MYFYIFIKLYIKEPTGYTLLVLLVVRNIFEFVKAQQNLAIDFRNGKYFYGNKLCHFFKYHKVFAIVKLLKAATNLILVKYLK